MTSTITDGQARRIAAEWQSPRSLLAVVASVGPRPFRTADDIAVLRDDIARELQALDVGEVRRDLLALDRWVERTFPRADNRHPAASTWSKIDFDYSPVTVDQV